MRIISTLVLLFIFCFSFGQTDSSKERSAPINLEKALQGRIGCGIVSVKKDTLQKPAGIRVGCCRSCRIPDNSSPLIVVDGVPLAGDSLGKINPNDIQRIDIIKAVEAFALFGVDGANGAILITKRLYYKKVMIKDAAGKSPIAAATVSFSFPGRENTLRYIADDSGVILSNSWKKLVSCEMTVTAVGYKTAFRSIAGDDSVIFLQREIKTCEEVILSQTYCPRRRDCILYCRIGGIYIKNDSIAAVKVAPFINELSIYPNPVQGGTAVNIRFDLVNSVSAIRVLSLDGRSLLQRPITGGQKDLFRLETDPRWAAGIYFIQLLCENGRVAASGKIIIR